VMKPEKINRSFQPTLCLFIKDFFTIPVFQGGTNNNVLKVPSETIPPTPWVELVGRVIDVSLSSNPFCFTIDDGTDACECLRFKALPGDIPLTLAESDVEPVVGDQVLVRGMLYTRDRFEEGSRKVCVSAVRAISPTSDDILLAHAERRDMRIRYGIQ